MEVNLIIKAPNQKVPDQTLTCNIDWTVKQLKEHISKQYPTKPPIDEQRLIFAGAYLTDEAVLGDALRQRHGQCSPSEDDLASQSHTVHLVCTQDAPSRGKVASRVPTLVKNVDPASIVGEDGLRRRINSSGPTIPPPTQSAPNGPQAASSMNVPPAFSHPPFSWNGPQGFRTEAEAQQAYHALMNWYMEQYRPYYEWYYRTYFGCELPANFPGTAANVAGAEAATAETIPAPGAAAAQPQAPGEPRMAPPNNQMRLDAQGNAFLADDDEEENGGREWDFLDWIYTIARMGVFLSIIYFYSNMFRFIVVVFCAFLLQYLHQQLRRHPAPAAVNPPPVAVVRPVAAEANDDQGMDAEQPAAAVRNEPEGSQDEADQQAPAAPAENAVVVGADNPVTVDDAPRGVFAVWAFFSAFFSSLFPEVPAN